MDFPHSSCGIARRDAGHGFLVFPFGRCEQSNSISLILLQRFRFQPLSFLVSPMLHLDLCLLILHVLSMDTFKVLSFLLLLPFSLQSALCLLLILLLLDLENLLFDSENAFRLLLTPLLLLLLLSSTLQCVRRVCRVCLMLLSLECFCLSLVTTYPLGYCCVLCCTLCRLQHEYGVTFLLLVVTGAIKDNPVITHHYCCLSLCRRSLYLTQPLLCRLHRESKLISKGDCCCVVGGGGGHVVDRWIQGRGVKVVANEFHIVSREVIWVGGLLVRTDRLNRF